MQQLQSLALAFECRQSRSTDRADCLAHRRAARRRAATAIALPACANRIAVTVSPHRRAPSSADCHAATAMPATAIALPSQSVPACANRIAVTVSPHRRAPSSADCHAATAMPAMQRLPSPQLPSQHRGRTATAMQRLPSHCRHSQRSCRHSTEAATAIALPSQSAPRANSKRAGLQLLALALD